MTEMTGLEAVLMTIIAAATPLLLAAIGELVAEPVIHQREHDRPGVGPNVFEHAFHGARGARQRPEMLYGLDALELH